MLTEDGPVRISVPRDRDGAFAPVLIPKHARRFTGFDDKIIAMYARGMTVREIQGYLREQMPVWRASHPGVEEMKVAVMGCVVNGPGESKHANLGISLPGTFEEPKAPVYVDGKLRVTLKGDRIVPEFLEILNEYVTRTYPAR